MDKYKLKFTKLQNEIFGLMCIKAGTILNQRNVAKLLKVSPTAVSKSITNLEKEGLIKTEKSKTINLTSIQFNRDKQKAIELKRVENLKQIYQSKFTDLLEEKFPGATIILFGSYSKGEDITSSDIDIAIIGSKEKEINLDKFEKILERTIMLHHYEHLNKIDKNLRESIINGIILNGNIEL